jgi:hypothetical protein
LSGRHSFFHRLGGRVARRNANTLGLMTSDGPKALARSINLLARCKISLRFELDCGGGIGFVRSSVWVCSFELD